MGPREREGLKRHAWALSREAQGPARPSKVGFHDTEPTAQRVNGSQAAATDLASVITLANERGRLWSRRGPSRTGLRSPFRPNPLAQEWALHSANHPARYDSTFGGIGFKCRWLPWAGVVSNPYLQTEIYEDPARTRTI